VFEVQSVLLILTTIACLQAAPQDLQDQALKLREVAVSGREDRFEEIVRFIERTQSDAAAKVGMEALNEAVDALNNRLRPYHSLPSGEYWVKYQELSAPLQSNVELIQMDAEVAKTMARTLFAASRSQRVQLIKKLAREAGDDWPIKDDDSYFGPMCGTYDHTFEQKIQWAARRYREEAIEALGQPGWSGRRRLMIALDDFQQGKTDERLKRLFVHLSRDSNTLVRGQAILSLARYPSEETLAVITQSLTNRAADTRLKALYVAETLKLKEIEPAAIRMLAQKPYDVPRRAIAYLGAIATPRAKSKLIECLKNPDLAWPTLHAIKVAKCKEAVPFLCEMLANSKTDNRGQVLEVVVEMDPATGADEIEKALKTDDEDFLRQAICLVGPAKLQGLRSTLQRLLTHKNEYVKSAAVSALETLDGS
jgi:hypothetical protein